MGVTIWPFPDDWWSQDGNERTSHRPRVPISTQGKYQDKAMAVAEQSGSKAGDDQGSNAWSWKDAPPSIFYRCMGYPWERESPGGKEKVGVSPRPFSRGTLVGAHIGVGTNGAVDEIREIFLGPWLGRGVSPKFSGIQGPVCHTRVFRNPRRCVTRRTAFGRGRA